MLKKLFKTDKKKTADWWYEHNFFFFAVFVFSCLVFKACYQDVFLICLHFLQTELSVGSSKNTESQTLNRFIREKV